MIKPNHSGPPRLLSFNILGCLLALWLLSACQTYDGFPTTTPEPTRPPTSTPVPLPTERPTLPPPPTLPPRPTLPPAPAGVQPQKAAILKEGFDALLNNYFQKLDSSDIYEVGLRSIQIALEQAGVAQPEVPIPGFGNQKEANWNSFLQAYTIVLGKYQGQVSEDLLAQVALLGAANSLQDCQTTYVPPDRAESYLAGRVGQQAVIGIGINLQSGQTSSGRNVHIIARPISGGPAEKAGLRLGDQLVAIDGTDLGTKTNSEVIQLLQGRARGDAALGTKVTLTIVRGAGQPQSIELTRDRVQLPMVESQVLPNKTGYIRFNRFPLMDQRQLETNSKALEKLLSDFNRAGVTGLVLDLRGNSQGSITVVQNFLSYFVGGDQLLYLSGSRSDGNNNRQYGAFPMPSVESIKATDLPLVVLVDDGTAAEAEMFAHAIQRAKRGLIVGEPTAGCLNASSPVALKDNSVLNISVYRTISDPKKPESIVTEVQPEELAEVDLQQLVQGKDNQLEAALKALRK